MVSNAVSESNPIHYYCLGVVNDPDDREQYFINMDNYYAKINVGVYYKRKNGKWAIDHFDSGSTNWWEDNSPENNEATEKANQRLKHD